MGALIFVSAILKPRNIQLLRWWIWGWFLLIYIFFYFCFTFSWSCVSLYADWCSDLMCYLAHIRKWIYVFFFLHKHMPSSVTCGERIKCDAWKSASGWYWAPKPLCERMWMSNKHRGMFETRVSAAETQNQANEVLAYWCKPWGQRSIKHLAGFQSCHGLPHQMTRLKNGRGTGAILVELTPDS